MCSGCELSVTSERHSFKVSKSGSKSITPALMPPDWPQDHGPLTVAKFPAALEDQNCEFASKPGLVPPKKWRPLIRSPCA